MKKHIFYSPDQKQIVYLTQSFIAITFQNYTSWEEFLKAITELTDALEEVYQPGDYTRIGIRYYDLINRAQLNLKKASWKSVLNNHIIGLLASDIKSNVKSFEASYDVELDKSCHYLRLNASLVKPVDTNEECLLVDSDFYCQTQIKKEEATDVLNYLHDNASHLIYWLVKDKTHKAMGPIEYETL